MVLPWAAAPHRAHRPAHAVFDRQDSSHISIVHSGVRWIRNAQGQPVIDRAYNMVQLLNMYMGRNPISGEDVSWDVANPNQLSVRLRGAILIPHFQSRCDRQGPSSQRVRLCASWDAANTPIP